MKLVSLAVKFWYFFSSFTVRHITSSSSSSVVPRTLNVSLSDDDDDEIFVHIMSETNSQANICWVSTTTRMTSEVLDQTRFAYQKENMKKNLESQKTLNDFTTFLSSFTLGDFDSDVFHRLPHSLWSMILTVFLYLSTSRPLSSHFKWLGRLEWSTLFFDLIHRVML